MGNVVALGRQGRNQAPPPLMGTPTNGLNDKVGACPTKDGGHHPSEGRFGGFRQSAKRVLGWQARPTRPLACGPPMHLRFYCLFVGPLTLPTPGRPLAPPAGRAGRTRLAWPKIRVLLIKTSLAMCGFVSWFALVGELCPPVWSTTCVGPPCLLPGALSCR
jgi:hypothetical protein